MYALGEDSAHPHEEVGLNVAMEWPRTWIVGDESDGHPSVRKNGHRVAYRRVNQVKSGSISLLVEQPHAITQHPEVMPMEVP